MKRKRYLLAVSILLFLIVCAVLLVTGIGCPIRYLTGIPCPGCGMTRACLALLFGDPVPLFPPYEPSAYGEGLLGHVRYAMHFHPLVLVLPPAIVYMIVGKKPLLGSAKREFALLWTLCGLMLAVYLVRLALHDPVLAIDWDSGLLARVLHAAGR